MHPLSLTLKTLSAALLLAGLSATAQAQALFDHNKALAGNVTPGDAPGYPITLSRPGHYRLTGNLTVPLDQTAIEVTAENVTIDLNGFTVAGPATCVRTSAGVSCSGSGSGVAAGVSMGAYTTLRNGTVQGFYRGVQARTGSVIESVTVRHNANSGVDTVMSASHFVHLNGVRAVLNGGHGLSVGSRAIVTASAASDNGMFGIFGYQHDVYGTRANGSRVVNNVSGGVAHVVLQDSLSQPGDRNKVVSAGGNIDAGGLY